MIEERLLETTIVKEGEGNSLHWKERESLVLWDYKTKKGVSLIVSLRIILEGCLICKIKITM
jgi:hypothetical protein